MAAINPVLVVEDIVSGVATTTPFVGVAKAQCTWKLGAPEDVSYSASGDQLDTLTPGVPPPGTRIIGISLDGGTTIDTRLLSTGAMVSNSLPAGVSEAGQGLALALTKKVIERLSAQQVSIFDVFNGTRGTVKPASGGVATPGGILFTFQGISPTTRALWSTALAPHVAFNWVIPNFKLTSGAMFWDVHLDIDVNRDTPIRATQAVAERLGSFVDPQRAQYVCDSGDFGVLYAEDHSKKQARTVTLGHLGTTPVCTFQNMVDDDTPQPILEGSQFQPQTLQMLRSVRCKGGSTQHGVPFNGKLTDIVCINNRLADATGDVQSGLPIISVYGDRNHGGVAFMLGDGSLHMWSQAMGVLSLCYCQSLNMLYAATDAGVYQHSSDINDTSPWRRLGAMAFKCSKVLVVNQRLYALAEVPGTSIKHVVHYVGDGTNTPAGQTGTAMDGWESVYAVDGLFDFAVTFAWYSGQSVSVVYALTSTAPGYLLGHAIEGGTVLFGDDKRIPIPSPGTDSTITPVGIGLDAIVPYGTGSWVGSGNISDLGAVPNSGALYGAFLRTDSGSDGLYWLAGAATVLTNVSPMRRSGINLVDALNTPVQVNQVCQHIPGLLQWGYQSPSGQTNGVPNGHVTARQRSINLLVATSRGAYLSPQLGQGPWVWLRTDGQSNLGDINIKRMASGPPRLWLFDQIRCPIYGIDDSHLYVSYNGGINWLDVFANTLDAGPAFFHLHRKWAMDGRYPNNNTETINYPDKDNGPYKVERSLDGLGQPAYVMVNPASPAPVEGDEAQEIAQIATASMVPEIQSSILLLDAMARVLAYNAAPQTILQMKSKFEDTADVLRFLRPTHQVRVNGTVEQYISGLNDNTPITLVTFSNLICYVLEHTMDFDINQDEVTVYTDTKLGVLCLNDRADPAFVDADLWQMASRIVLYSAGAA